MKASETKLRAALREVAPPTARSSQDFWEDFRARAALVPQAAPHRAAPPVGRWLFAVGAAAALIVAAFTISRLLPDPAARQIANVPSPPPPVSGALSQVEDVQVFEDDASVMVFEDSENGGTVVFVEASPPSNHT
ncbi:MAG: hypothetical protein HN849_31115 [Victivallales bacterium]|jgi:hypothetical protein|nr:hypothetical protein [Victivallales bacterium]MBT7163182.1 hypothetical protein [Victivallales bacterium]MBT7304025.1 hypothetical protein [Victivallales bacterium]